MRLNSYWQTKVLGYALGFYLHQFQDVPFFSMYLTIGRLQYCDSFYYLLYLLFVFLLSWLIHVQMYCGQLTHFFVIYSSTYLICFKFLIKNPRGASVQPKLLFRIFRCCYELMIFLAC